MSDPAQEASADAAMDATALYREDVFTDQRVGTIRRLTPVTADGDVDASRPVLFHGQAQILTPAGALPINFELPGGTLSEAVAAFGDAARQALEDTMRELQEYRRDQASSIVIPEAGAAQGLTKGPGGGPAPGGKIQLR